jgi:cysteine-rich repeat protein
VIRLACLVIALGGCITADAIECENGIACPLGTACDLEHFTCVQPEQLVACEGLAFGDSCMTETISGVCAGAACLPLGCGNYVLEAGELCDDGNEESTDGCRADCQSDERCGNGVVDPGELCDDGNLRSRDGCDSQCGAELTTWRIVALSPSTRYFAYDSTRGQLVVRDTSETWVHDGMAWTIPRHGQQATPGCMHMATTGVRAVVYDSSATQSIEEWTGTSWTSIATINQPSPRGCNAAALEPMTGVTFFDMDSQTTLLSDIWTLDATGSWNLLGPSPAGEQDECQLDALGGVMYLTCTDYALNLQRRGFRWTGTAWAPIAAPPTGTRATVAFRDELYAINPSTAYVFRADMWQVVGPGPGTAQASTFEAYVTRDDELVIVSDTVRYVWTLPTWTPVLEPGDGTVPVNVGDRTWHLAGSTAENLSLLRWSIDAADHAIMAPPATEVPNFALSSPVYSSGRHAAVVLSNGVTTLGGPVFVFDGTTWSGLSGTAIPDALIYDPEQRAVLMVNGSGINVLLDTTTTIGTIDTTDFFQQVETSGWDARNRRPVIHIAGTFTSADLELFDKEWRGLEIAPSSRGVPIVGDQRRGTLITTGWERLGENWYPIDPPPLYFTPYNHVNIAATGELVMIGRSSGGTVALVRRLASDVPDESCLATDDLDGDELFGCADPDCYWACDGCPPYSTCE